MTQPKICFVDTETTSLRPDRRMWEIGIIERRYVQLEDGSVGHEETDHHWFIGEYDLDLGNADPFSLKIGRFYERHPAGQVSSSEDPFAAGVGVLHEHMVLPAIERITRDAIIVGAVPNFDTEVLGTRMRANGIAPAWHYHLVDVETLAAGAMKLPPPWNFDKLLAAYGLTYDEKDRHTALGDARMARDLYDAVMKADGKVFFHLDVAETAAP